MAGQRFIISVRATLLVVSKKIIRFKDTVQYGRLITKKACLKLKIEGFMVPSLLIPVQTIATSLVNNSQHCWMLHVASVCKPCCMLLGVVAQSLKLVKLLSQQLPTFFLFRDRRSVGQQCWKRLHSSSNIVGVTHAHYT